MIKFTHSKTLNIELFNSYLVEANSNNQFTNYGSAVRCLETTARTMLRIDDSKAIIAVCNGAAGLSTIIQTIRTSEDVYSQDFTFPCNFQIPDVEVKPFDLTPEYEPDIYRAINPGIVIITNCFGHVNNIKEILTHASSHKQKVVFDNAASPYSFYEGSNISNYGIASFISLHHTKPIGFGEGGLVIIDKLYEEKARSIINFGLVNGKPTYKGNNYKMSELSAAAILQWWNSFNIDILRDKYLKAYNKYVHTAKQIIPNYSDNFFPNCLPIVESDFVYSDMEVRKYYAPNKGLKYSVKLYDKIKCIPITEFLDD
jgi:dTDP-4-amino-4,6-dideoxygalactose transaminase